MSLLKKMSVLLLALPAVNYAAEKNVALTITGEVYRQCIIAAETLEANIGAHHVGTWVDGQDFLSSSGSTVSIPFTLTDCDPGTTIKISTKGGTLGAEPWFIGNQRGNNPDLQARLQIKQANATNDSDRYTFWMDKSRTYTYKTTANGTSTTSETLTFFVSLRRPDVSIKPVGTFSGDVTIFFTFE